MLHERKDHYGLTVWTIKPSLEGNILTLSSGSIQNSEGVYELPEVSYDISDIDSVTIVCRDGVAYYVFWRPDCVMDEGFHHMLELVWKEGEMWLYAENEDSRSDY